MSKGFSESSKPYLEYTIECCVANKELFQNLCGDFCSFYCYQEVNCWQVYFRSLWFLLSVLFILLWFPAALAGLLVNTDNSVVTLLEMQPTINPSIFDKCFDTLIWRLRPKIWIVWSGYQQMMINYIGIFLSCFSYSIWWHEKQPGQCW